MFGPETRVLVVDDMHSMRKLVVKIIMDMGFKHIVEAQDGDKAWELLKAGNPVGLVISDWSMPNCTGLELLKRVRGNPATANTPFLLVTAEAEASQVGEAIKAGVDNYILKPFTIKTMTEKLEAIEKKRAG